MLHVYHRFETYDAHTFQEVMQWFAEYGIDETKEEYGHLSFKGQICLFDIRDVMNRLRNLCAGKPYVWFRYEYNLNFLHVTATNQKGTLEVVREDRGYVSLPEDDRCYMCRIETDDLSAGWLALEYDEADRDRDQLYSLREDGKGPAMTVTVCMLRYEDYLSKITRMQSPFTTRILFDECSVEHGQWGEIVVENGTIRPYEAPRDHGTIRQLLYDTPDNDNTTQFADAQA